MSKTSAPFLEEIDALAATPDPHRRFTRWQNLSAEAALDNDSF